MGLQTVLFNGPSCGPTPKLQKVIQMSLIPQELKDWYSDSDYSDEEKSSDLEADETMGFVV